MLGGNKQKLCFVHRHITIIITNSNKNYLKFNYFINGNVTQLDTASTH